MSWKAIVLSMFLLGILGMLGSLSGFAFLEPSMLNLFFICMGFMISTALAGVSAHELVTSKD